MSRDLVEASEHLHYEADMLRKLTCLLVKEFSGEPARTPLERNALIESFCVHSRNLLEFLYRSDSGRHRNALRAEHYFDGPSDWPRTQPSELDNLWDDVSEQIDHLTTDRFADPGSKEWDFTKIAKPLLDDVERFHKTVSSDKLSDDWEGFSAPLPSEVPGARGDSGRSDPAVRGSTAVCGSASGATEPPA